MNIIDLFDTPWKVLNEVDRQLISPMACALFLLNGIKWDRSWRLYGLPLVLKHRRSIMQFGNNFSLRSTLPSNPLGSAHRCILCTWQEGAVLEIGNCFGMTGGSIITANRITIGNHIAVGANTTIIDTDFHPLNPQERLQHPQDAKTAPIIIEDHVFIGMNSLILKGVTIGRGSVIGAGSVVTRDVPPGRIAAGNPAKVVGVIS